MYLWIVVVKCMVSKNLNNSAKNELISVIFGVQNPEEISHQKIANSPTSPE